MTTIVAVSNQKGGVAKTTTCLSLGATLTEMGHWTLLIDLDPQASLTFSMGLKPKQLRRTVGDALLKNASLIGVSHESSIRGLDIVPANQSLLMLEKLLYQRQGFQFRLKEGLGAMSNDYYDFALIDCPPFFGTLTLNALAAADLVIIPIQCEYYAIQTLIDYMTLIQHTRQRINSHLKCRVLVTMYDRRNRIYRLMLAQMQQGFPQILFNTVIEVDTKLRESPAFGQPITAYAPEARGAKQYRALAKELLCHD
jgi:chromosome partitioning protein